jgi:hypothetical protein
MSDPLVDVNILGHSVDSSQQSQQDIEIWDIKITSMLEIQLQFNLCISQPTG